MNGLVLFGSYIGKTMSLSCEWLIVVWQLLWQNHLTPGPLSHGQYLQNDKEGFLRKDSSRYNTAGPLPALLTQIFYNSRPYISGVSPFQSSEISQSTVQKISWSMHPYPT